MNYVAASKPLAENGTLKWSEYYVHLYDLSYAAHMPPTHLQRMSEMITTSSQLEKGTISMEQFMAARRATQIAGEADFQERSRQARINAEADAQRRRDIIATIQPFQPVQSWMQPASNGTMQVPAGEQANSFCSGFAEGFKTIKGNMGFVPLCPLAPLTPLGSTPFREGIKEGVKAGIR